MIFSFFYDLKMIFSFLWFKNGQFLKEAKKGYNGISSFIATIFILSTDRVQSFRN